MWYFCWMLGIGLAISFGVLNGIWYEFHLPDDEPGARNDIRRDDAKRARLEPLPRR